MSHGENELESLRPIKPEGLDVPGLIYRARKSGWLLMWSPRSDLVARGYPKTTYRLWPTSQTPPRQLEPTADEWEYISTWCQKYQLDQVVWAKGGVKTDPLSVFNGTIKSLSSLYQTDPDSPFRLLRFKAHVHYTHRLKAIEEKLGDFRIVDITFREFRRWNEEFCEPAKPGGPRRAGRGYDMIAQLRVLLTFGMQALPESSGCRKALLTLAGEEIAGSKKRVGGMRFRGGRRTRKEYMLYEQAKLICAEAHRAGWHSLALAQAMMTECGVRQKDVIGEWVPHRYPGVTEVIAGRKKWLIGARWEEIDADFIWTHRLSKSLHNEGIMDPEAGKTARFPLLSFPLVVDELRRISGLEPRREHFPPFGPVIVRESTKRPWSEGEFRKYWRGCARKAGLPDNIQNRDSRPGASTEAVLAGASMDHAQRLLGHSKMETTEIYIRDEIELRGNIARLRAEKRK